jgi:hypothetical protein
MRLTHEDQMFEANLRFIIPGQCISQKHICIHMDIYHMNVMVGQRVILEGQEMKRIIGAEQ